MDPLRRATGQASLAGMTKPGACLPWLSLGTSLRPGDLPVLGLTEEIQPWRSTEHRFATFPLTQVKSS